MDHSKPHTVKAVRCHQFASVVPANNKNNNKRRPSFRPRQPQALRLRDCLSLDRVAYPSLPTQGKNKETWITIQTEYAGVQYPDALQARGLYQIKPPLPYIPGMDVVGTVLQVHHSDTNKACRIRPGDRVMATLIWNYGGCGGLSEVVMAPLKHVFALPSPSPRSNPLTAAAFANIGRNYFAAYHSLVEVGQIDPSLKSKNAGTIVLVTGASGGVGMATIELAKAMGCLVVAGVSSPSKIAGPDSVGAHATYCYGREKAHRKAFRQQVSAFCRQHRQKGVDLVVDMVQGDLFKEALVGCLKPLGTIALVGFAAGQRPIQPGLLLIKEARVAGSLWSSVASEANEHNPNNKYSRMVQTILGYLADGSIAPRVDKIVPLSRFLEAFEVFEENKGRGNTVVSFVDDEETTPSHSRL